VVLDPNHTHDHALSEVLAYSPLVSVWHYPVVCDTVLERGSRVGGDVT